MADFGFTVCPVWPLRYLSTLRVESRKSNVEIRNEGSFEIRISVFEFFRICGLERAMGIEPTSPAWKAGALPLCYARNQALTTISLLRA